MLILQKVIPTKTRQNLKTLTVGITLVLGLILTIFLYVMTAPPIEVLQVLSKLQFDGRSALRKRPSVESAPIAYSQQGTRLEILHSMDDWVQVRIEGSIKGWTEREQGMIIPPPPPQLTSRQRAKQRLHPIFAKLINSRKFFKFSTSAGTRD